MRLFATCFGICIASLQLPTFAATNEARDVYRHALAGAEIRKAQCYDIAKLGAATTISINLAIDMDALEASGKSGNIQLFAEDIGDNWKLRLQTYNEERKQWEDATGVGVLYMQTCR